MMALAFVLPQTAHGKDLIRIADPSVCVDGMETDPDSDDLEPILADIDGGCMVPETVTISI